MDRLDSMRIFVAVADANGFAPAARRLGLSAPAVSRAIAALETRVGAQLIRRTTRQVALTDVGQQFHADCKRILAEIGDAEAGVRYAYSAPQGQLAITAPQLFGRLHVAPLLLDFLALHPQLTARAVFVDDIVHLLDDGFDVALRIAHLPDSGLTATRVGHVRRVIVASPHYLARHGVPRSLADLAQHEAIGFTRAGSAVAPWFLHPPGADTAAGRVVAQPRMKLIANSGEIGIQAALAGRGLARALSYQVAQDVQAGRLHIVLADHEPDQIPVQLVYVDGRKAAAKTRAFVDFAAHKLRGEPILNGRFAWPDPP